MTFPHPRLGLPPPLIQHLPSAKFSTKRHPGKGAERPGHGTNAWLSAPESIPWWAGGLGWAYFPPLGDPGGAPGFDLAQSWLVPPFEK